MCFGIGILLFFQADGTPALWAPIGAFAISCVGAFVLRGRVWALSATIALAAVFAGFAAGAIRTRSVAAPVLDRVVIAPITGFIEAVEDREDGQRLLLRLVELKDVAQTERPRLVRVSVRKGAQLSAGQFVAGTARLLPPPEAAWPGGYDFARDAYYKGIGAVGSMVGQVRVLEPPVKPDWTLQLAAQVDAARNALTQRIASAIGGPAGGVGAALVTGKRGLIPEPTNDVLRAAGIYHIVSISGLHMVLAAGTFFWLARALLALAPAFALLWPVKKIAAVAAMVGATVYCIFSGSDVATERSLVMTLVMFGAVLVDRPALSIRNLSIAALIVLAREPEALLGPSFQMSFGAVAAMMALVPLMHLKGESGPSTVLERSLKWSGQALFGLLITTLVASLATAPFSAYHFQSLNPYGLVGNALALPLVSLVVMPSAVLGVLAYPFGLDRPVWQLMGAAVSQVLEVSAWVGSFSGSTLVVPALGIGALALLSLALLVLTHSGVRLALARRSCLPVQASSWRRRRARYDIFVDRDGAGAAIRSAGGQLALVGRPSDFVAEQWLRADGDDRSVDDAGLRQDARCDSAGCIVIAGEGRRVAFVQDFAAFEEDCRRAAVIVSRIQAPPNCSVSLLLDRDALKERGAATLRFGTQTVEILSVRKGREVLPLADAKRRSTRRLARSGQAATRAAGSRAGFP